MNDFSINSEDLFLRYSKIKSNDFIRGLLMIRLQEKLKRAEQQPTNNNQSSSIKSPTAIRDAMLLKEIPEAMENLPLHCNLTLPENNVLHKLDLLVKPEDGYWKDGQFRFFIEVPENYNFSPPKVLCCTQIWHPNIDENGKVCLSILRVSPVDKYGWLPTRRLRDVIWGIASLFSDLCDFSDPLNTVAAEEMNKDEAIFRRKVRFFISQHAS